MRWDLRDKVILVTGAARGIGEQLARRAAEQGARLALVGLEPERLSALAAELNSMPSRAPGDSNVDRHCWYACDVTDQEALERAVASTVDTMGGIDIVVANAGIANIGTIAGGPVRSAIRTIEVNLIGVVRTVAATLPHITARRGHYLLISSVAAFAVLPGMAAYAASKAGVEQFGNALRLEVAHTGVTVGTAHPIWVDTDMVRDFSRDFSTFGQTLRRLPWPLNTVVPVEACARALLSGVRRRSARVYVPRSVGLVQAARTIVSGPVGRAIVTRAARTAVPQLESQARALGRTFGEHSMGRDEDGSGVRAPG